MKYNNVTLGHIEAIINKLGGEQGMQDFLAGRTEVIRSSINQPPRLKNLEPQGILAIPSITLKKADAFKHRDGSNNPQLHYDNFKNIVLANGSSILESSFLKIPEYKLIKGLSDFEIRDELGGEAAMCVSSYDEVLIVLHQVMQNEKYRDGYANIVYFMHEGVLHYAYCYWYGSKWYCDANRANSNTWDAGYRVFGPATTETQS